MEDKLEKVCYFYFQLDRIFKDVIVDSHVFLNFPLTSQLVQSMERLICAHKLLQKRLVDPVHSILLAHL